MSDTQTAEITIAEAINRALGDAMADDETVVMLGEDIADPEMGGIGGITRGLSSRFGEERVRSTPISEQAIMGAAIGASLVGYKPVAEIMLMNFTTVAMDMIVNHAAKLRYMSGGQTNVPIVIGETGLWLAALLTLYTGYDYLLAGMRYAVSPDVERRAAEKRARMTARTPRSARG